MSDSSQLLSNPDLTVIFALPGRTFSREFLLSWSNLLFECIKRNIKPVISSNYSSVVHYARAKVLGADVLAGPDQKPFQGKIDYDYIMFIDSDQVFDPEHFFKLLKSPYDVCGGMYLMEDMKHFPIVKDFNEDYFAKHGSFPFMTPEEVEKTAKQDGKYFECAYNGLGFSLIKKGVIEQLKYPWFFHDLLKIGELRDMPSEDVSFALNLKKAGIKVMVDSEIRVGHIKLFVI